MSEPETRTNNQTNTNNTNKSITAVELAELVINTTSTLIPVIAQLGGDEEIKSKIIEALSLLQRRAIDYTIAAAKRSQYYARRNNGWRRRSTWQRTRR